MLKPQKTCSCFMIRPPLKRMRKSFSTPLFFILLILINFLILSFMILPCKYNVLIAIVFDESCNKWFYMNSAFFGSTIVLFIILNFKNPGYLTKPKKIDFLVINSTSANNLEYAKNI